MGSTKLELANACFRKLGTRCYSQKPTLLDARKSELTIDFRAQMRNRTRNKRIQNAHNLYAMCTWYNYLTRSCKCRTQQDYTDIGHGLAVRSSAGVMGIQF